MVRKSFGTSMLTGIAEDVDLPIIRSGQCEIEDVPDRLRIGSLFSGGGGLDHHRKRCVPTTSVRRLALAVSGIGGCGVITSGRMRCARIVRIGSWSSLPLRLVGGHGRGEHSRVSGQARRRTTQVGSVGMSWGVWRSTRRGGSAPSLTGTRTSQRWWGGTWTAPYRQTVTAWGTM